ncbi:Hint domain-containing protein [Mesobacterium sp. TK19101]|uniref:Hint domain-containing protein n=1 Tax=Mesobacterium hydrothermale TaxID=3111907 RepID=A0ABU6HG49_9RHOB|nr:Hint domain-containing protein [Mesobacterium sp. TK19101]MEC3860075.1 Hint domain-containing protein [Mesobacterium sp. TK19101]
MAQTGTLRPRGPDGMDRALVAGTTVYTSDGALPVEYLNPGDRIVTRDAGMATLRAIRSLRLEADCVSVAPGSLGNARPEGPATLLASCPILLRDWRAKALFGAAQVLVPAARIVDGTHIRALGPQTVDVLGLVFDAPHILYVDGVEVAAGLPHLTASRV